MLIDNLLIIFEQSLLYLPLILGAYCSMSLMKVPNLAIESAFVFGAILSTKSISLNFGSLFLTFIISILLSMIGGALTGLIASLITVKGKLSHLLSAIVTIGIFSGINLFVLGSAHLTISNNSLILVNSLEQYPALTTLLIISAILTVLFYFFLKTQLGVSCAIYGNNPKFFSKYKISGNYVFIMGMIMSNMLAGISGFLVCQVNGFVDVSAGLGIALFCITVLMIGKALFKTKSPISIAIPFVGILIYFIIQQILLKVGFDLIYFTMAQAIIVLIKVMILQRDNVDEQNQLGI